MPILIKGGNVDLEMQDGGTIVLPKDYGIVHDTEGAELDACTLFLGPFVDAGPLEGELPGEAADYFGNDYQARRARIDVPDGAWNPVGRVHAIVYFRPGRYEDDWRHEFDPPPELLASGDWYAIRMPDGCVVNWRGIVKP